MNAIPLLLHDSFPLSLQDLALVVLALIATYTDLTVRRIPNKLTVSMMVAGLVFGAVAGGGEGLKLSVYGLLAGFAILILPCEFGVVGGGDAKFLTAVGALQGVVFVVVGAVFGMALATVHCAVVIARRPEGFRGFLRSIYTGSLFAMGIDNLSRKDMIPYGVWLAAGVLIALALFRLGIVV